MSVFLTRWRVALSTIVVLGWQQLRATWRLLFLIGVGMVVSVLLVLFIPLFAHQSLEAGFQEALALSNANPAIASQNINLTISAQSDPSNLIRPPSYSQRDQALNDAVEQQVGAYLHPHPERSISIPHLDLHSRASNGAELFLSLIGTAIDDVTPVLKLNDGRLPQTDASVLEGAIPADVASELGLSVGSTITVPLQARFTSQDASVTVHIAGIFQTPSSKSLPFFQVNDFTIIRSFGLTGPDATDYPILLAHTALYDTIRQPGVASGLTNARATIQYWWLYQPDTTKFDIEHVDDIVAKFEALPNIVNQAIAGGAADSYDLVSSLVGPNNPLHVYQSQVSVADIPIAILLFDIVSLMLFFMTLIVELLIDEQATTIAQLRSRGISHPQIFGSLLLQSVGLGVGALVASVALFVPLVHLLLPRLLPTAVPNISFLQQLSYGLGYALFVIGFAIIALWCTIALALRLEVLNLRREASRSDRQPLWQRLHLDLALGLVLIISFALSLYATRTITDPQTAALIVPISLVAPTLLVISGLLVALRGLPWFFRQCARLAARRPGVVPFLACVQLARTPQTILRLLLMFALTVSFTVYVFIFAASQDGRIFDITAQAVGADIVGLTPATNDITSVSDLTQRYATIPQVTSVTVGIKDVGNPIVASQNSLIDVVAVDTDTYQRTAVWPGQTGSQNIQSLLSSLSSRRASALKADAVPALVNSRTWDDFHLTPGAIFQMGVSGYGNTAMHFVAVAEVTTVPFTETTDASILVDYQTYNAVRQADTGLDAITPYVVWLRVANNQAYAPVMAALANKDTTLLNLKDRHSLETQLRDDPLTTLIVNILIIGLILPLALASIGNLIAVWTQMRQQAITLALSRALGMASRQIRNLLIWQMGIMQGLALVLGGIFGAILAITLTPALVFTTTTPDQLQTPLGFYQLQTVMPVRIVVPVTVFVAMAALLVMTIVIVGLGVLRLRSSAVSQALRLNDD